MNVGRNILNALKKPYGAVLALVIIGCIVLAGLAYRLVSASPAQTQAVPPMPHTSTARPHPTATSKPPAKATPTPIVLPPVDPSKILGVAGDPAVNYTGVTWVRLGHPTCGWGNLRGDTLRNAIQQYHRQNIRVLLTICQTGNLYDAATFNDVAQAYPDAVQCGNEEMKQDSSVSFLYVQPDRFAKFYDMCASAIHKVNPRTPVLLGSLDPHVAAFDYQLMANQVSYLDQMQTAMNTTVHPGGNWNWHNQILGLIDSWHNGWDGSNNLQGLFQFWAQQFQVNLDSGDLGKHLWVVEGTGCFKGCGIDANSSYEVAASHIMALVTDVQTIKQYHVPFFYFSGEDFDDQGIYWPIGILDKNGHPKPLRQDLPMGARTLNLTCGNKQSSVENQLQLLASLYDNCALPANYVSVLTS